MLWFAVVVVLLFLLLLFLMLPFVVTYLESNFLFYPQAIHNYDNLSGTLYYLPESGGAVLHVHGVDENLADPEAASRRRNRRKIVFLHGNSGHLGSYQTVYSLLDSYGYDVYAVEYVGFGMCSQKPVTIPGIFHTIREAWNYFADEWTILMGFSIGGILIGQLYEELTCHGPAPAQLVFLNTFGNLPYLVYKLLPDGLSSFVLPFMSAQWITPHPQRFHGPVLIVTTSDDTLIPPVHSWMLAQTFQSLQPVLLEMPNGGHELGAFIHVPLWFPSLLSPTHPVDTPTSSTHTVPRPIRLVTDGSMPWHSLALRPALGGDAIDVLGGAVTPAPVDVSSDALWAQAPTTWPPPSTPTSTLDSTSMGPQVH